MLYNLQWKKNTFQKKTSRRGKTCNQHKHWVSAITTDKTSCVCICLQNEKPAQKVAEAKGWSALASLSYMMWCLKKQKAKQSSATKIMIVVTAEMTPPRMVVGASFGMLMRKSTKGLSPLLQYVLSNKPKTNDLGCFLGDRKLLSMLIIIFCLKHHDWKGFEFLTHFEIFIPTWWDILGMRLQSKNEIHLFYTQLCTSPEIIAYNIFSVHDFHFNILHGVRSRSTYDLLKVSKILDF